MNSLQNATYTALGFMLAIMCFFGLCLLHFLTCFTTRVRVLQNHVNAPSGNGNGMSSSTLSQLAIVAVWCSKRVLKTRCSAVFESRICRRRSSRHTFLGDSSDLCILAYVLTVYKLCLKFPSAAIYPPPTLSGV